MCRRGTLKSPPPRGVPIPPNSSWRRPSRTAGCMPRRAGVPGAVAVPVQRPRGADRGGDDAAGPAVDLPRPAPVGRAGQPAVVGGDGLRHHHRRCGARHRAHRLAAVEAAPHGRQEDALLDHPFSGIGSGAADVLLDDDHHRRAYPDLHPAAPGRPHVRADGLFGDLGVDRCVDPGADRGAAVLLLVATARPHARRQSADGPPDRVVQAGAGACAGPPASCPSWTRVRSG
ncbi:hypothetical protein G6F24_014878 [Rhizopus arrhizus]|nr:hypothetical protein G6F24_014878 [Rhizopus arrhizus]